MVLSILVRFSRDCSVSLNWFCFFFFLRFFFIVYVSHGKVDACLHCQDLHDSNLIFEFLLLFLNVLQSLSNHFSFILIPSLSLSLSVVSMEICDPRKNVTMCPLCDRVCSYWNLSTACGTARASHLFDNPATVFFSIFMALWGEISTQSLSRF